MKFQSPRLRLAEVSKTPSAAVCQAPKHDSGLEAWSFSGVWGLVLGASLLLPFGGCSKKPDIKAQAAELAQAFAQAQAPSPAQAGSGPQNPAPPSEANVYVAIALAAVQTNDDAGAIIALQMAQRKPGTTAAQLMAVQRTMEVITSGLIARAANGDARAREQLAEIERTRSQ
jgi:hypothetical protein